jgi:hypothetical protein
MKQQSSRQPIWLPLAIAVAVVVGLFIGNRISPNSYAVDSDRKVNAILSLINQDYVDSTNLHDLIEMSIPEILSNLDPHTTYFSAEEIKAQGDHANSSMRDIGIQVEVMNDTVGVVEVISGGPAARVGIMTGDRIVSIDGIDGVSGVSRHVDPDLGLAGRRLGLLVGLGRVVLLNLRNGCLALCHAYSTSPSVETASASLVPSVASYVASACAWEWFAASSWAACS